MEKFCVKCFMAVAMLFMTTMNVSAYDTKFEDLADAQKQLAEAVKEGMALNDALTTKEVKERLNVAVTAANAVYDSSLYRDIAEINKVMPDLVKCIEEAKASKEKCAAILVKAEEFVKAEQAAIEEAAKEYKEGDEVYAALEKLYDTCGTVKNYLGQSEHISDAMVEAFNGGASIRDLLAMSGFNLPTIDDTITAAGIHSVENAVSDNAAEYNLAGAKVPEGYKGIVIKGGKKIIRR